MNNQRKIVFAPGSFDQFFGTQEELDELVAAIQYAIDSGEIHSDDDDEEFVVESLELVSEDYEPDLESSSLRH